MSWLSGSSAGSVLTDACMVCCTDCWSGGFCVLITCWLELELPTPGTEGGDFVKNLVIFDAIFTTGCSYMSKVFSSNILG